jgi:hypothetical protein
LQLTPYEAKTTLFKVFSNVFFITLSFDNSIHTHLISSPALVKSNKEKTLTCL